MSNRLQTVVETAEYIKQAKRCMDEESRKEFIDFIAHNPFVGDLIPATGGARKVRWSSNAHQGKRGGTRIIYYYHNYEMPIFLFTAYTKNQKDNLTMKEKNCLHTIIKSLIKIYEDDAL